MASESAVRRREQWRETQQQSVEEMGGGVRVAATSAAAAESQQQQVFKFDSFDRERYLVPAGQALYAPLAAQHHLLLATATASSTEEESAAMSPASGRSPHSSMSSPQVGTPHQFLITLES
jgi:hypothetical protein